MWSKRDEFTRVRVTTSARKQRWSQIRIWPDRTWTLLFLDGFSLVL